MCGVGTGSEKNNTAVQNPPLNINKVQMSWKDWSCLLLVLLSDSQLCPAFFKLIIAMGKGGSPAVEASPIATVLCLMCTDYS